MSCPRQTRGRNEAEVRCKIKPLLVAIAVLAAHHVHYKAHDPGCRSERCDDRVDVAWSRWEAHERWWSEHEAMWAAQKAAAETTQTPQVAVSISQSSSPEGGAASGLPACTWQPESGGDWHALNPSGAGGKYQIMPSTWAAHGGQGEPQNAPPAEQERVAAAVWASGGAKEWVNC